VTVPETLLELPADPTSLRLVRLVAATLADSVGLDFEDVEDVRLAVDELCAAAIRASAPDTRLRVTFTAREQEIEVEGLAAAHPNGAEPALDPLSAEIVAAVTTGHTLVQLDGINRFHFVKRHETDPA
jgi:hypothetical protein